MLISTRDRGWSVYRDVGKWSPSEVNFRLWPLTDIRDVRREVR
jgi:hypothetical protein